MILAFIPVPTVPENTRPKAKNLPLSDVGTIFEMYIINSPLGSQVLMPNKQKSIILNELFAVLMTNVHFFRYIYILQVIFHDEMMVFALY